ncbi:MAG TPA: hypothetical protein VNA20_16915 [Frankiaceae bacterium]|nr:hypothetical protein [Frankiaceae bacterium]
MRLRTLTMAGATAAHLLLVPFAGPADAVTTTSTIVAYNADTDGDGRGELWTRPADGTDDRNQVFVTANDVWLPALSPDGTRVAYLEDRSGSTNAYTNYRLFVRDTDGGGTATLLYSGADVYGAPAWSRDGERLVFSTFDWDTDVSATYIVPSGGGALTPVPTMHRGGEPSFAPSGDQVAVDVLDGKFNTIAIELVSMSTGTRARIAGTEGGSDPVWSPDGQYILFQKFLLTCGIGLYRVPAGGGTPVTIREVPGYSLGAHEYSRDGTQIFFTMVRQQSCNPGTRAGDIWVMNADSTGATRVASTPIVEYGTTVAGGTPAADTTPPPAPANTRATLSYSHVTLSWPTGGDTTHFVVLAKDAGAPAPTSVSDGTLVYAGPAHWARYSSQADPAPLDFYVFAYDSSGNASPVSAAHRAQRTPTPSMRIIPRVGGSTTDTTAQVRWGSSGVPAYELQIGRRTRLADGTWTAAPVYGAARTTTVGALDFQGAQGQTYYFRARATDGYGNFTAWAATPSVAYIPFDDTASVMSYSGAWAAGTSASRYLGTYRASSLKGSSVTVRVHGGKLVVRGDRCSSCGAFAVYEDGVYRKTIDTYATTSRVRQTLYTGGGSAIRPRTLRLVVVGTAGRSRVSIDSVTAMR